MGPHRLADPINDVQQLQSRAAAGRNGPYRPLGSPVVEGVYNSAGAYIKDAGTSWTGGSSGREPSSQGRGASGCPGQSQSSGAQAWTPQTNSLAHPPATPVRAG